GGGVAHFSSLDSSGNAGVLQFGGVVDFRTPLRVLGIRLEARDFITGHSSVAPLVDFTSHVPTRIRRGRSGPEVLALGPGPLTGKIKDLRFGGLLEIPGNQALVTLPDFRHVVHTRIRLFPPFTRAWTGRRFTFQRRRLTLWAW